MEDENMNIDAMDWKDGETDYCHALVVSKGNTNVPSDAVASYLDLQRNDAARSLAYARLHGDRKAARIAELAVLELDALISKWVHQ
jgi:hypothetical protein